MFTTKERVHSQSQSLCVCQTATIDSTMAETFSVSCEVQAILFRSKFMSAFVRVMYIVENNWFTDIL